MRKLPVLFFVILLLSCGRYYRANIAGYVKDEENKGGINGARVRIYSGQPAAADAAGYILETSTMASGGNNGYFSQEIIWLNWFGSFGDEGDTGEIWIGVTHEDYVPLVEQRTGILSDSPNVLADILMQRATFEMTSLEGRIIDSQNTGVNGVRVVLDLESTPDDDTDYVVVSRNANGEDGVFTFNNIRWRDETADTNSTDTENAGIYIDDTNYNSGYDINNKLAVTLSSGDEGEVTNPITVTRKPRTVFSANIQGRCLFKDWTATDNQEFPIRGVNVTLTYDDDNGTHTFYTQTNANGTYTFAVEWEQDPPSNDGTGLTLPEGEDVIKVTISFEPSTVPNNVYAFGPFTDYAVKSWVNPNNMPDCIDTDPAS